jgi:hypothetical protein
MICFTTIPVEGNRFFSSLIGAVVLSISLVNYGFVNCSLTKASEMKFSEKAQWMEYLLLRGWTDKTQNFQSERVCQTAYGAL